MSQNLDSPSYLHEAFQSLWNNPWHNLRSQLWKEHSRMQSGHIDFLVLSERCLNNLLKLSVQIIWALKIIWTNTHLTELGIRK